jgi:FkbM family methyltransferase
MRREKIRAYIASHRSNPLLSFAARGAEKYLRAYNNQQNWNVRSNGEARALRLVTSQCDGDVFDVGANVGQWSSMALEVIGSKRLHCFEPAASNFEKLRTNLASRPNLIPNNLGLGDENKEIAFYFYPNSPTRSTAYYLEDGYQKQEVSASIVRGDDYMRQNLISNVSFLKLDVEGMEIEVLKGFAGALKEGKIQAVQFEHGLYHIVTRHFLRDFLDLFHAVDYEVLRILPAALQPLRYDIQRDETFSGENFLAARSAISSQLMQRAWA